jgi:hypothetical protein
LRIFGMNSHERIVTDVIHDQTPLHVNHAPQKRLLKKRVASPNPASCKSM